MKCSKIYEWRFNIKFFVLLMIMIFYCGLEGNANDNNDFETSKEYCISGIGSCKSANANYGVAHNKNVDFFPVCYSESVDNPCLSNEAFSCLSQKIKQDDYEESDVEEEVVPRQHDYFVYGVHIIIFTSIALVGTLVFQSNLLGISFIEDETAFSSKDATEFIIDKSISVCSFIVFSLILASSVQLNYMKEEQCRGHHSKHSKDPFCNYLDQCQADIRSVVFPSAFFASHYRDITITVACLLLAAELFTFIFPPEHDETVLLENGDRIRQMVIRPMVSTPSFNSESGSALVYVVQTPRGRRVSRTYMTPVASPRASEMYSPARYLQHHSTLKRIKEKETKNWIFGVKPSDIAGENQECSICLESLKSDSVKVGPNRNDPSSKKSKSTVNSSARPRISPEASAQERNQDDDQFDVSLQAIVQIPCKHYFHELCIFEWIRENSTCPVCRADITTGESSV